MSRTPKYRAWYKEKKQMYWVGDMSWTDMPDHRTVTYNDWPQHLTLFPLAGGFVNMREQPGQLILVSLSQIELMPYTGLQDRNGLDIFEGDILRWGDWEQEGTEFPDTYIVSYQVPSFVWDCYRGSQKLETNGEVLRDTNEFEVIGNIYENPDLLHHEKEPSERTV